jgi:hypothetical protein
MQLQGVSLGRIVLLVSLGITTAGCEVIGNIFQAGMWVGVIMVVLVIGAIAFVASKFRSGPR